MKIETIQDAFIPQYSTEDYCLCSHDQFIYSYCYQSGLLKKVCQLPYARNSIISTVKYFVARSWIYRKFINKSFGINHVFQLPNGVILALYDKLYRFDPKQDKKFMTVVDSSILKSHPLKNSFGINPLSGDVYFGDYICGKKSEINVYRITQQGTRIDICFTFKAGEIQHIHSIQWDSYRNRMWILTGDEDGECFFYFTDDDFKTVEVFNGGDQTWRAVSLVAKENSLIWGMDAGQDAKETDINYTYKWDFTTKSRTKIASFKNPTYHSVASTSEKNIFMGVNFEPKRKQDSPSEVKIYHSNDGDTFTEVITDKYSKSNITGVSRYGYAFLPLGVLPINTALFTLVNVQNNNFKMMRVTYDDH